MGGFENSEKNIADLWFGFYLFDISLLKKCYHPRESSRNKAEGRSRRQKAVSSEQSAFHKSYNRTKGERNHEE